ncbi:MAG: hypothetical protein EB136_10525, partial [Synechococcaceae bacterium WBB_3_034]|nr:hypothetical protein [Synechococcaceae bacterium WBB_3_034]
MSLVRLSGDPALAERWCAGLRRPWLEANQPLPQVVLVLAGTDTAAVPGISAAGVSFEVETIERVKPGGDGYGTPQR